MRRSYPAYEVLPAWKSPNKPEGYSEEYHANHKGIDYEEDDQQR